MTDATQRRLAEFVRRFDKATLALPCIDIGVDDDVNPAIREHLTRCEMGLTEAVNKLRSALSAAADPEGEKRLQKAATAGRMLWKLADIVYENIARDNDDGTNTVRVAIETCEQWLVENGSGTEEKIESK